MKKIILLLGLVLQGTYLCAQEAPDQFPEAGAREENYTMRLTARVVDEEGKPMAGVPIRIGIHNVNDYKDQYNDFRGKTDAEGKFSAEGVGRAEAWIEVKKGGYYVSRKFVTCYEGTAEQIRKTGKYLPWDPLVDIVVRKVDKPIPMRVWLGGTDEAHRVPKIGQEFGFDLFEKDWVKPHGKGKHVDLFIKFSSEFKNQNDYKISCSIRFANPDDGLIPVPKLVNEDSLLKYPRTAPEDGYKLKKLVIKNNSEFNEAKKQEPLGYLVRLRSLRETKTKKITSAFYGKIVSSQEASMDFNPFEILPYLWVDRKIDPNPRLQFRFYLNPNQNDRNLEYDQVSNLAPNSPKGVTWLP